MSVDQTLLDKSQDNRRSLAGRISVNVARRMSGIYVEEERHGTVLGMTFNTLCNVMGAGVLSLPLAFYKSSVLIGICMLFFSSVASAFAVLSIVKGCEATGKFSYTEVLTFSLFPPRSFEEYCQQEHPHLPDKYIETEAAVTMTEDLQLDHQRDEARRAKRRRIVTVIVELIVFLNNYGALIIYARVISDSIPPVVESFLHAKGFIVTRFFWLLVSGVLFFFLSCVRNMSELKWSSLLGFVTIFYIVMVIVTKFFVAVHNPDGYNGVPLPTHKEINWLSFKPTVFQTMSTFGVAFGYHFNVPYFYKELKDRTTAAMMETVGIGFPLIVGSYLVAGLFGYLTFGDAVADVLVGGDIVRNYSSNDIMMNIGRLALFLHFACVYPILSVCARRGLHRLLMTFLLWPQVTESIEAPLRRLESIPNSSGLNVLEEPERVDFNEEDVGSPETTTRSAIAIEAFFIVLTTVLIAGVVSGISFVIDVIGTLFGLFLMLIGPGIIGWLTFGRSTVGTYDIYAAAPIARARIWRACSAGLIVSGAIFMICGTVMFVMDAVNQNKSA